MKLVKLSVFALSMGLLVASCGNGKSEASKTDTTTTTTTTTTAPAPEAAPATTAPVDTMNAGAAKPAETKMETKKEEKMKK